MKPMLCGTEVTTIVKRRVWLVECPSESVVVVGVGVVGEFALDAARQHPFTKPFDLAAAGQQMAVRRQRTARMEAQAMRFGERLQSPGSVTEAS